MPTRHQRQRTRGWRTPHDPQGRPAVYVGRGTRYGNPFIIGTDADDAAHATSLYREWLERNTYEVHPPNLTAEQRQVMDERRDWIIGHASELAGRDLLCWCRTDQPCHADTLLELAATPEEARQ